MFSYRHIFHAGNHADVLKHLVLISILRYQIKKEKGLLWVDTHAGAGLYHMDASEAKKSGELFAGFMRIFDEVCDSENVPELLQLYIQLVNELSPKTDAKTQRPLMYPGSPWFMQHFLREQDSMRLFELHPTDSRILVKNMESLSDKNIAVVREDSFKTLKSLLPPVTRRGLVLMDPSYEIKSDYSRVVESIKEALQRFSTGTYAIWYPIIERPEAHSLPRKLKTLAQTEGKPWLNVTLRIKSGKKQINHDQMGEQSIEAEKAAKHAPLVASGMMVINPPHCLQAELQESLPHVVRALKQDSHAKFVIETSMGA